MKDLSIYFEEWKKVRAEFKSEKEAIEVVKNDGDALQYVDSKFFSEQLKN
ncbi:MAG: hypothetical protein RR137_10900 [Odoribacter sp.]